VRVCQRDERYYSYTEIPLECHVGDIHYNILMASYVSRAGADLALALGLAHMPPFSERDDVLFAVFARSRPFAADPLADSALCVFPMRRVQHVFTTTIQACFNGLGNTGPAHMVNHLPCVDTVSSSREIVYFDKPTGLDTKDCPLAQDNQIWLSGK
jgi:hypothetical protein